MNLWWMGRLQLAETLILIGLGGILYQFMYVVTGWPASRSGFLTSLAVAILGFVLRLRRLRYP